jgi:hypothetical protein
VTVMEKVADWPVGTVWLTGCVVIAGAAAGLPALLTIPVHPKREDPISIVKTRRGSNLLATNGCLAALIWPRQLDKLRAELQHAPLPTVNTGVSCSVHLTKSPKRGSCPTLALGCPCIQCVQTAGLIDRWGTLSGNGRMASSNVNTGPLAQMRYKDQIGLDG